MPDRPVRHALARVLLPWSLSMAAALANAQPQAQTVVSLPPAVAQALERAQLPADALSVYIAEAGASTPRLLHREQVPVNPASLMKLYTTGAGLEILGPAYTWTTSVLTDGRVQNKVLRGDLIIQGRGDPGLVLERVWLMLRQVQQRGIQEIRGDIVLDRSAFEVPEGDPGEFDGEPSRPYNVQPDALMLNYKALTLGFVPDPARRVARITSDARLAGVRLPERVPLSGAACGDWRGALKADLSNPAQIRFGGHYPAACGEQAWPIAYAQPASYNARLIGSMWRELGGRLSGHVRDGVTPPEADRLLEFASQPLAAVVRDINKFSNNMMAQQLFFTLGLPPPAGGRQAAATMESAREQLTAYARRRSGCAEPELVIDNGSGLSRNSRSSVRCMAALLQSLWSSPVMPEFVSSLPITGVDGTARRSNRQWGTALGRAHLKTGSLRDVAGIAGYVDGASGRRYVLVAIVNHAGAQAARPVLDALVQWTAEDTPR
jgi:D-alanyl-D-alanine carboxypeptidase/D-alanyl-D-alanine-endopeptidase (penicillin-binding protein 4)